MSIDSTIYITTLKSFISNIRLHNYENIKQSRYEIDITDTISLVTDLHHSQGYLRKQIEMGTGIHVT